MDETQANGFHFGTVTGTLTSHLREDTSIRLQSGDDVTLAQYIRQVIRDSVRVPDAERCEEVPPCAEYPLGVGVPRRQHIGDMIADALAERR